MAIRKKKPPVNADNEATVAVPGEPSPPFLSEAEHPVNVASPSAPRTAIAVGDNEATVTLDGEEHVFSGDELHNLRRQIDAAYVELH